MQFYCLVGNTLVVLAQFWSICQNNFQEWFTNTMDHQWCHRERSLWKEPNGSLQLLFGHFIWKDTLQAVNWNFKGVFSGELSQKSCLYRGYFPVTSLMIHSVGSVQDIVSEIPKFLSFTISFFFIKIISSFFQSDFEDLLISIFKLWVERFQNKQK